MGGFLSVYGISSRCDGMAGSPGLNLGETAIHEQFHARNLAAVVGGEKYHGLGDLIGAAEPAKRPGRCH
jgi:hypothetical protein